MLKRVCTVVFLALSANSAVAGSADALLDALTQAKTPRQAMQLIDQIWQEWLYPKDHVTEHTAMRAAIAIMNEHRLLAAERAFSKILERDPEYTECYNKRATVRFFIGDLSGSEADIYQTLSREPRHFGAISGLAMIKMHRRQHEKALEYYRLLRNINPTDPEAATMITKLNQILGRVDL